MPRRGISQPGLVNAAESGTAHSTRATRKNLHPRMCLFSSSLKAASGKRVSIRALTRCDRRVESIPVLEVEDSGFAPDLTKKNYTGAPRALETKRAW